MTDRLTRCSRDEKCSILESVSVYSISLPYMLDLQQLAFSIHRGKQLAGKSKTSNPIYQDWRWLAWGKLEQISFAHKKKKRFYILFPRRRSKAIPGQDSQTATVPLPFPHKPPQPLSSHALQWPACSPTHGSASTPPREESGKVSHGPSTMSPSLEIPKNVAGVDTLPGTHPNGCTT